MIDPTDAARTLVAVVERYDGRSRPSDRLLAHETPVEMRYGGVPFATLMASPTDLEDFAVGFSLSERIVTTADDVLEVRTQGCAAGYVIDLELPPDLQNALGQRTRRSLRANSGCGLCGRLQLEDALPDLPDVDRHQQFGYDAIERAIAGIQDAQHLNRLVRSVHGAAWVDRTGTILLMREDVGRHNALDKMIGARARGNFSAGFCVITSRASYEMVEKAAIAGIGVLVAVSAPTALARSIAQECGMTLIGLARSDGFMIFADPNRSASETCFQGASDEQQAA